MGFNEAQAALETNTMIPAPRMRTNRTTAITLATSWQRVDFNGTSVYNANTFQGAVGSRAIEWDSTNKLFKFNATSDRNYDYVLYPKITATTLISTLNLTSGTLQYRFVIPAPTPVYFPFPDSVGLEDLMTVNMMSPRSISLASIIYANSLIRQYGLGVEVRLSNAVVGTVTLDELAILFYGR